MNSDELFLNTIQSDLGLVFSVIGKIFSGLFLTPEAISVTVIFVLGILLFTLKSTKN